MEDEKNPPEPSFEEYPLTRSEYISAMVHFYRGELGRADAWRARLDPTTNWAVVTTGAMFSFAFSAPDHSHVTLLLTLLLVSMFLGFEARRFRYFDCWRSRVRMIEENFWIPMLRRNLVSPREAWSDAVADDLDHPTFKMRFLEAVGIRLRFNYLWIYLVVLLAWLAKVHMHPVSAPDVRTLLERMTIGPVPGPAVLALVLAYYGIAIWLVVWSDHRRVAVDEVRGLDPSIDRWKT